MGGNAGIRGYIVQTIICVLDSLEKDHDWQTVTLEPLDESEKVDIRWKYSSTNIKVSQVKSSENIIKYSSAKKWCEDLKAGAVSATSYELICVGHPDDKLLKTPSIDQVNILPFRNLNIDSLIDEASTKIDKYYEQKGKPKISAKVREILVKSLTTHFANNSITGREISRSEFDSQLLSWIIAIEKQIEENPYSSLAPPELNEKVEFNHRIVKKIVNLIGWDNFNENEFVEIFNEHKNEFERFSIDFWGNVDSKLKDHTTDLILISSIYDVTYPLSSKPSLTEYLRATSSVYANISNKKTYTLINNSIDCYSLLFWFSLDNSESSADFVYKVRENYKRELLTDAINYLIIDNSKFNFLISSIITAKNYRQDIVLKFLYPITELNHNPGKIGQRGPKLPVQYINSSVLPIIKEDSDKISILMFCSDPFSQEALDKILWLTVKLTSGLANEYIVYFPDYDDAQHKNDANETIRKFNEGDLNLKINVHKYLRIDANLLDGIDTSTVKPLKDQAFKEDISGQRHGLMKPRHLNETFTNILPYGDILKPFLKTEAITANDLKIFLAKKGIFFKGADKNKIINLMSTLLFGPKELQDFKELIDIKDRPTNTVQEFLKIKHDDSLKNAFKKIKPNLDNITEGLSTKLLNPILFEPVHGNSDEFIFSATTERKDPNSQISVNTVWGKVEISYKKDNDNLIINTINTISKDDRVIAKRIIKAHQDEFKRIDLVQDETLKVLFKNFKSNSERANFLLSFSNVSSSHILKDPDIKSVKFKFDESMDIPDSFKDKKGKDLITFFKGKNLSGLNEISEADFKKLLLLEEIFISYKFELFNIKGFYSVKYNFSDALKNKVDGDGIFKTEPFLAMNSQIKSLKSIDDLKRNLSKEIERLKMEKFKQFGIIV